MNKLLVLFLTILCTVHSSALDSAHFLELNKKARAFAKQQDWKSLRQTLIEIGAEMPGPTPNYMLRMASVETHLGHKTEAIQWMRRYAATGLRYDVTKDDDLKPLAADQDFRPIAAQMERQSKPIAGAQPVCTFPIADLMPEDLAWESLSSSFIVSSIRHHALYRVSLPKPGATDCALEEIPLAETVGHWTVMAVSFDTTRKLLWTTISAITGFSGITPEEAGKAAVLAMNPASGMVIKRFDLKTDGPAVLGDMSVAADGSVYFTDSIGGGVYRVHGDLQNAKVEQIAKGLLSPQTPVLALDGKRLLVADYVMGVATIDLSNGEVAYLAHPEDIAVTGLDGLLLSGDTLIGIQNGTEPERIVRYQLDRNQTKITSADIVEQSTPGLGEPTHAVELNGMIYVTANVGWNKIDGQGKLKVGEQFSKPTLVRFSAK